MKAIDVVNAVAKALRGWDGSPEQAAEKLGAAVEAVKSFTSALPAPSEEKPNPEFHIEDALKTIKYNDSVANIRLYATVALESALKDLAALRSRLPEPKEHKNAL